MADERRVETVREFLTDRAEDLLRELGLTVNGLLKGQSNNYFLVTLTEGISTEITIREDEDDDVESEDYPKMFIGTVPIMLRSAYCMLAECSEKDLAELGECPYDQGGYFIINGSEKVLVALGRVANLRFRRRFGSYFIC